MSSNMSKMTNSQTPPADVSASPATDSLLTGILSEEQRKTAGATVKHAEQLIGDHPVAALAAALAAGACIGWIVKRW